ncbi:uncharacterized protein LOC144120360 [Amblyomma americanum]
MPGHCCVPGCRGNYDGEKPVRVFTFPADADRRRQWLKAIPRADFEPGKRSVVCERHFKESDIRTSSKYVDSKTGKVVEAKLKIARLSSDAISSVFPNCPAYLSAPATTSREAPTEKRMRLEAASLRDAIAMSLQTHEEEEAKNKIDTFQVLLECLPQIKLSDFWNVISRPACVLFLNLAVDDVPRVLSSVTVLENLTVKVHYRNVQLTTIDGIDTIPHTVHDIRCLIGLLDAVESFHGKLLSKHEEKIDGLLKLALSLLEDALNCELADVEQPNAVSFLKEQVSLLLVKHSRSSRYSAELLVFSSILFTVSLHAYRELAKVLEKEHHIRPPALLETGVSAGNSDVAAEDIDSSRDMEEVPASMPRRKRQRTSSNSVLAETLLKLDAARAKRHEERMAKFDMLIEVMRTNKQ